jgi:CRISPR/Cas system CSM-associated protein Csm3 (group 7 of RAMP superfamily)
LIPPLRLRGDQGELKENLRGLKLLEMDALGGSGSRGYGRIAI